MALSSAKADGATATGKTVTATTMVPRGQAANLVERHLPQAAGDLAHCYNEGRREVSAIIQIPNPQKALVITVYARPNTILKKREGCATKAQEDNPGYPQDMASFTKARAPRVPGGCWRRLKRSLYPPWWLE